MANQNLKMVEMTEEHRKFSVDLDQVMGALINRNPSIGLDELIIFFARYVASLAESIGMGERTYHIRSGRPQGLWGGGLDKVAKSW